MKIHVRIPCKLGYLDKDLELPCISQGKDIYSTFLVLSPWGTPHRFSINILEYYEDGTAVVITDKIEQDFPLGYMRNRIKTNGWSMSDHDGNKISL